MDGAFKINCGCSLLHACGAPLQLPDVICTKLLLELFFTIAFGLSTLLSMLAPETRSFGIGGMFGHGAGIGLSQALVIALLAVLHLCQLPSLSIPAADISPSTLRILDPSRLSSQLAILVPL
jgi:hypothetical protein